MSEPIERIDVHLEGIGHLIKDRRIEVPPYQRSFAWEADQVEDLFQDLSDASRANNPAYFLGTIVLTPTPDGKFRVIDGQQRIATTLVCIAEMRNFLRERGDTQRSDAIQSQYIAERDRRTLEIQANVVLNERDNPFFQTVIVNNEAAMPTTESHKRIAEAKSIARKFVERITARTQKPGDVLNDWLDYIQDKAQVIVMNVKNEANAYMIFEVLNDRGIALSIADLLKTYLFKTAGKRLPEVQDAWTSMRSRIESVDREQAVKTFIRHVWSSQHGLTRERDLYDQIKDRITGPQQALDLSVELNNVAEDYVALFNPTSQKWRTLGKGMPQAIYAFGELRIIQNRPLILAILRHFKNQEIQCALPALVSWTVRFLIHGSGGSGGLENLFSSTARKISAKEISSAKQLFEEVRSSLPTDEAFRDAFARASVSKRYLARYYLRAIAAHDDPARERRISQDTDDVNLEHILPQNPGENWNHIADEDAASWHRRIGNLTIMDSALNVVAANASFNDKKEIYAQSEIEITRSLADVNEWTPEAIQTRQDELAEKAVKVWRLKPRRS